METTPKITIEELAVKLNGKMWTKGDLKRIYLDRGYNTKKMSTKTYVFEKDGEFIVVCNIDCPSQAYQWIKSQEQEVIDGVYENIEAALVTDYYLIINNDTALFVDSCGSDTRMNDLGSSSIYFSKEKAERFIEKELFGNYSVQLISREAFDRQVDELQEIEDNMSLRAKIERGDKISFGYRFEEFKAQIELEGIAEIITTDKVHSDFSGSIRLRKEGELSFFEIYNSKIPKAVASQPIEEYTASVNNQIGWKVKHNRFGLGTITAVSGEKDFIKLSILFEDGTTKELLERFANLQKVD